ncbi:MAG: SMI1/KNR4 family protein [Gammaproteobacteria bacterium]
MPANGMGEISRFVIQHQGSGDPVFELDENPYRCEFWPLDEIEQLNRDYEVAQYAPGYFGFATSGGGEMFAIAPSGAIVCLPFIGMEPETAIEIAPDWPSFARMLRLAS